MESIERRTLEWERERWKRAIKIEEEAIATGTLSFDELSGNDLDLPSMSRREHLLELQSRLATVESQLASEELSIGIYQE
jgi:hypothetical protein